MLHNARARAASNKISAAGLKSIEDVCIRDAVALQEAAGLEAITDGEFRRTHYLVDFMTGFSGIVPTNTSYALAFKGEGGASGETRSMLTVNAKVKRTRPVMIEHFKFLKSLTRRTSKFCLPSPTWVHMRGGRKTVAESVYPDIAEFWNDVVKAFHAEIADLAAAGCTYLQIDEISFAFLCDAGIRERVRADGLDPDQLTQAYARLVNEIAAGAPASMAVTVHTCRGNFQSMWMAEGGYDRVAEIAFDQPDVDGYFMEYDSARAGGFEPLRYVPKTKKVVLGLVSSKKPEMESKDALKRRIDEAAKFFPLERLCLSPQCGFASTHHGNKVTEDIEKRKLALIVEVANDIWGTAA